MILRGIAMLAFMIGLTVATGCLTSAESVSAQPTTLPLPLLVSPTSVVPGETIHVSATGLAGQPIAGQTGCLGILGPGQNVELNQSPQFRPQIGMIAIGSNGNGQADAVVPVGLVGGSYRVILGGCSPHGDIAPLATEAQATIMVVGPTVTPAPIPKLPATGGVPAASAFLIAGGLGIATTGLGWLLRRRARLRFS